MVEVVMVEVATAFLIVKEDKTMDDPVKVENNPLFRLSVEIPIVDVT
jgi:hypothetical protein